MWVCDWRKKSLKIQFIRLRARNNATFIYSVDPGQRYEATNKFMVNLMNLIHFKNSKLREEFFKNEYFPIEWYKLSSTKQVIKLKWH